MVSPANPAKSKIDEKANVEQKSIVETDDSQVQPDKPESSTGSDDEELQALLKESEAAKSKPPKRPTRKRQKTKK